MFFITFAAVIIKLQITIIQTNELHTNKQINHTNKPAYYKNKRNINFNKLNNNEKDFYWSCGFCNGCTNYFL